MISLDQWETIRLRCVRDGERIKTVARDLGISRNTVRDYVRRMEAPSPPHYDRGSKLDPFVGWTCPGLVDTHISLSKDWRGVFYAKTKQAPEIYARV